MDRSKLLEAPERRAVAADAFELRSAGSDGLRLTGYASVFNHDYPVLGGPPFGWNERVDPKAFDATLAAKPDLHLLINHEGMPLARTKSGTLQLSTDSKGLLVEANLDKADPDVQRLEAKMRRGDMDEMSFAFRVKADKWSEDESQRTLTEVSLHKGDVSVVNFGANDATSAQLNSISDVLTVLRGDVDEMVAELRADSDAVVHVEEAQRRLLELHRRLRPGRGRLTLADYRAIADGLVDVDLALRGAIAVHHTAIDNGTWDGPAAVARLKTNDVANFRKVFAWFDSNAADPDGDGYPDAKSAWKLPHHEVSDSGSAGAANLNGVRNALSRLPQSDIPSGDNAAVRAHLQAHLDDAK